MNEQGPVSAGVLRIYLTIEEILADKVYHCSFQNCVAIMHNIANLQMHLKRHHKIPADKLQSMTNTGKSGRKLFFCPFASCPYFQTPSAAGNGARHFNSLKLLKQHYFKVHGERKFVCEDCGKTFATVSFLRHHHRSCGQTFVCDHCSYSYGSREALLTHAKRKQHGYEELLLAKKPHLSKRVKQLPMKLVSTGTQTIVPNGVIEDSTNVPTLATTAINGDIIPPSSSSDIQPLSHAIEPDHPEPLAPVVCTETQTDFIDVMFANTDNRHDPLLSYSHMYTQTSDEPDLFADLGLSTIETQTSWNEDGEAFGDYLVSTETQTNFDIDSFDCANDGNGDKDEQMHCKQTQMPDTGFLDIEDSIDGHPSAHTQTS